MRTCQNCHREFEQASDNRCPHCGVLLVNLSKRSIDDKKLRGAKPKTPPDDEPVEIDLDELLAMEELTDTNQGGQTIELSHFVADDDDLPEVDPDDITPLSVPDLPPLSHQTLAEQDVTQADVPSVDPDDDLVLGESMSLDEIEEASFGPSEDIPVGPTIELDDFLNLDDEEPVVDIEDMTPLDTSSHESVLDDDDEPPVDADDVTPLEIRDEPVVKRPTVADRNDMTMEFQSMPGGDEPAQPSTKRPTHTPESDQTIDISAMQRPTGRSTHSLEADKTIDLSMSPAEARLLDSQWRGTIEHGTRQGQTIRQRETITGFRSSLPVKSRYVREKRKEGAEPPRSLAEVPDYELLDIIGEGGMGVVYAAHQSSIARTVAVKMLKPSAKVREEQRDKFISEAVVTGELDHPNIVPIYDLGSNDEGALFYSMKRVRGTPWDKVIHQKSLDENVGILMRVADAVAFAHAGGVIHRDLKPENVMLGDYGEVLVMDWGLARITPEFAHVNAVFQADSLGGTPAYMSPEMAKGPVEAINKTSDIYLLGAILYEIIGGQPPHSGRDVMQCLMAASQNRIDPNRYDGELKSIALKAMATQQADRYQTVKEFQEAIRVYQSHSESLVLTANANQNLQKARAANDYPLYARALYGFQESLTLWDENHRAQLLLTETQRDYATCALEKGDLDLAASLLDSSHEEHEPIIKRIDKARAERDARQRRLRLAKFAVAALLAIVVTTISVAAFIANNLRGKAVIARNEAEQQKGIAVQQRSIAEEQKAEADKQRTVAVEQKGIAEKEKVEADKQRAAAVEQKGIAEQQKVEADKQRTVAVEQKGIAETQRQKAEDAKKAEEYEAYIAQIGLANAKINENAYDFALQLLNGVKPELRNWEWGRLEHLCKLGSANYKADGAVDAVAYSPDGKTFVTGDKSGKVTLRDADTGNIRWQVPHGQYVLAVDYSANGRYIATGSNDKTIQILDAATGRNLRTLAGHTDGVLTVRFSPDGKQLLSGSYDNTARLWNLQTGATLQELKGHSWWVWAAEFSPKGDRIVTAGQDGKAIVWQKEAISRQPSAVSGVQPLYTQLTTFTGHDGAVYSARFSPDGKQVATGGYDKLVMIWNPDEVHPVNIGRRLEGKPDEKQNYIKLAGHDEPVRSVSFSPNGQLLLSGSEDHSVRVWDVALGKAVKALRGHGRSVRACEFSPDGKWALSGGDDESVRVWNVAGYQEMRVLHATVFSGHEDAVLSARYSGDGQQIITASRDRTASRWRADNGAPIMRYEEGHEFLVSGAVFFPDGKRLATGAGDNSVRIWDLTAGIQSAVLTPTGRIGTLAVSPDGNWLVTGSNGNEVKLWNAQTGEARGELTGHGAEVTALMFSRDGQRLASGDDRGRVRIWHLENRAPAPAGGAVSQGWVFERELDGHTGSITAMRFTPDGRRLVTASGDHSCGQWDVATGQEQRQLVLKHDDYVSSLDMSPDGTRALTACDDGSVRLWRLADATQLAEMKSPSKPFTSVAFSPDGSTALLTSSESKKVWRWDLSLLNAIRTPQPGVQPNAGAQGTLTQLIDFKTLGGEVWASEFAPDGQHILTIGGNDAQLWNLSTMRPVVRYSPHGAVASAALSPDGKLIATGSWDHSAKIWDAATGHAVRKLDGGHKGYINSVEFSSDGSELLTASDDTNALIWNVATGKPTGTVFHGHTARLLSATFSPDGKYVLTASGDKTAKIWNRAGGDAIRTLPGHTWAVLCAKFSADGKRVITGSQDADAWIWDADTGNVLVKLRGHTAPVTAVAFSPDGTRVLTGSQDNTAKLWDAVTGKEILSLPGHSQEVTSVSFSPDGRNVLTSSRDGTAIIWLANDWHKVDAKVAEAAK
jgi:WD40 repeat protein/serine/threonine protein kinase